MKNLLICGGEGFIGKNCLNYFSSSNEYKITSTYFTKEPATRISGVDYVKVDLRNEKEVQNLLKDKNIVIQAAATTTGSKDVIERPYLHVTDNAVMNSWIFREAVLNKVEHLVFFSCTVMYQSKEAAQKESDWSPSNEIYKNYFGVGNTKVYLEKMCEFYSSLSDTKFTAIRHSNVYGPFDKTDLDKSHVLPAMIVKILKSTGQLEIWGDGTAKRDLIYIDDLIDFVDKVISKQKSKFELFNCGSGKVFSISQIVDCVCKKLEKTVQITYNKSKPNIPTTVLLDCDKAKSELGWAPKTSFEDGVGKTVNWYKENVK